VRPRRVSSFDDAHPLLGDSDVPEVLPPPLPSTPARSLARAVLLQALHDLALTRRAAVDGHASARGLGSVEEWFRSTDDAWPFAFEAVCAHLQLEPDAVRRAVHVESRPAPRAVRKRRSVLAKAALRRTAPSSPAR